MPRAKRQKFKQERAIAMRAARKKLFTSTTTISPDLVITNNINETKIENDELTMNWKGEKLPNEIRKLHLEPREYTQHSTTKDSGNRLIHWNSLNKLIRCNTKCARCGGAVMLQGGNFWNCYLCASYL